MTFVSCANDVWHQNGESASEGGLIEFTATTTTAVDETRGGMDPLKVTGYKKQLWLIPTVEDAAKDVTRGTQLTSASILPNFGVSAYLHGKTEDITEKRPDFFYNKEAVRDATTGKYSFDQDYYWPSSNEYLSFMAYAPYGSTLATLADVGASEPAKGAQKISFTVAEDVANQVDLMTATAMQQTPSTTSTPNVNLQFEHQLAGIRFVVGDQFPTQGYIQKITLKNVYGSGIYTLSDGATPGSWSYGSRYNYVAGTADQQLTGVVGQAITTETQTFLMLPCTFASNDVATVEIDYWDGYAVHTVTASLAGVTWEAGKTYTYELSSQNLTKLKVKSIDFATTTLTGVPHSKWNNGDKVGLYVVQGKDAQGATDGHTLRYKNIPVTCTVSMVGSNEVVTWAVDHTTAQGNVYKFPGDSYYFYYPYKEGTPAGYPNECNEVNATATIFFSSVINSHTPFIDQSGVGAASGNFENSDLQVARAIVPEDANSQLPASTIKASLTRQVGLVKIVLKEDDAVRQAIFSNGSTTPSSTTPCKVTASNKFSGNKPYNNSSAYFFFVKPGVLTTFSSETYSSTNKDAWGESLQFNLSAGQEQEKEAHSVRKDWPYIDAIWQFSTPGAYDWTIPANDSYTFQCWGASGGTGLLTSHWQAAMNSCNISNIYGRGAYTVGTINLETTTNNGHLYIYVGGKGESVQNYNSGGSGYVQNADGRYWKSPTAGGFNGGGIGNYSPSDDHSGGGGGATDIRLANSATDWNSRIMVAAGGGGGNGINSPSVTSTLAGMHGGTPNITNAAMATWTTNWTVTVNQSTGYAKGVGRPGVYAVAHAAGGGGGGYYGGTAYATSDNHWGPASGGSSYISGNSYCTAHSSGLTFSGSSFKSGTSSSCPNTTIGGANRARTKEDGHCRITLTRY